MADQWTEISREIAARRVERRTFLRGALGISGLAMLEGSSLLRAAVAAPGGLPDPKQSGINTIVIAMMENRSTDHFFGWMPGIDGWTDFQARTGATFSNPASLALPAGSDAAICPPDGGWAIDDLTPVPIFRLEGHCNVPDPDHGWYGSRVEMNGGRLDGFHERSGAVAMGYYLEEDIPFLGWLARNYTTFANYHCSVLGPTFPNRLYLLSGEGGGYRNNYIPQPNRQNPFPTGHKWPSVFDMLGAAQVEWAVYASDVPAAALFFHQLYEQPGRVRHITDYYTDAAAGLLPPVVFLDPAFFTIGTDDHPAHDIKLGQRFIQDAFLALAEGPQWPTSAFVITYDEHGGFFDLRTPPRAPADRLGSDVQCDDWAQLGFRVPTVLASPRARNGFIVDGGQAFDHASIIRLLEWRFIEPLGKPELLLPWQRVRTARNLADAFDFEAPPSVEIPSEPPFIPVHAQGVYCAQNQVPEETEGDNPLEPLPDQPVPAPVVPDGPFSGSEMPHREMLEIVERGIGRFDMRERAAAGIFRD